MQCPTGFAYGLTEHRPRRRACGPRGSPTRDAIRRPRCSRLKPLVDAGVLNRDADIIIDAKSGVSGAGKTPTERTHFSEVHGSLSTYRVMNHRHGAEIEEGHRERPVTFTPHLLANRSGHPGNDLRSRRHLARAEVKRSGDILRIGLPQRHLSSGSSDRELPEIKHVVHTNFCDIGWRVDATGRVIIVSVIDNLVKGAAGQAIQNMNVMIDAPETAGLL